MKLFGLNLGGGPKTAPCPFCYKEIDPTKLLFRCAGYAAIGYTACAKVPDPVMVDQFGDGYPRRPLIWQFANGKPVAPVMGTDGTLVKCHECGSSGIPICPNCHSWLPDTFDVGASLFGLIGVRNSGKTVLLTVLQNELTNRVGDRFDASIKAKRDAGAIGLAEQLKNNFEQLTTTGTLPGQTAAAANTKSAPAVYEWKHIGQVEKRKPRATIFSFYDNAGEDMVSRDRQSTLEYLRAVSGVILLLDPFGFDELKGRLGDRAAGTTDSPVDVLNALTEVLRAGQTKKDQGKKLSMPVAVVLSKIDALYGESPDDINPDSPVKQPSPKMSAYDENDGSRVHSDLEALIVDEWGGKELDRLLRANYSNYRYFGLSALGTPPSDAGRITGALHPHRVAEPLLWLLAGQGFIPTRGGTQ